MDVIVYDLNVERKEVNLQWYFSFDANSSFETKVIYIPKTDHAHVFYGKNVSGNWYHYIIDRRRTNFEVSSPDQFLYPFDCYVAKILVGFNATLEAKNLNEELSKADFRIEKDIEKNIETYWDISNETKVLDTIPEEYAEFLGSADKTAFQIQIALTRKTHQWIIPLFSFWVVPIMASVIFSFALFLFVKKEEEFKIPASLIGWTVGLAGLLMSLLIWIQSQKPPSCITVAEGIIMAAFVWVIILPLLTSILIRKEEKEEKKAEMPASVLGYIAKSEFDINKFSSDVENFKNLRDEDTKYKVLERIRNQVTSLPLDGMPSNTRNTMIKFLPVLETEINSEKMRLLCLKCISAIYNRRDEVVNARIKSVFPKKIEDIYDTLTLEEKRKALALQQKLREHDFEFMKEILADALEWETDEFETIYTSIEFDELTKKQVLTLRETLWKWRSEANQREEVEKVARIDKFLNYWVFR